MMQVAEKVAQPSAAKADEQSAAALALDEFVRALARRQARIDFAKLVAANDNQRPH